MTTAAPEAPAAGPDLSRHRILIDSVNWRAVLAAVKAGMTFRGLPVSLAAGYLDGPRSQWPPEAWAELQKAGLGGRSLIGITVLGRGGEAARARVADSEPGDMNPPSAAMWASGERAAGHWPVIYCDRADKPHVIAQCFQRNLHPAKDYGLWVATLDGGFTDLDGSDLREQPGVVAVQYRQAQSPVHVAGQPPDLDVSLVVSSAWRAATPEPDPQPAPDVPAPSWKAQALAEARALHRRAGNLVTLLQAHQ
jgi:hypothetical protein